MSAAGNSLVAVLAAAALFPGLSFCQQAGGPGTAQPPSKRIFGIIPNFRTAPSLTHYQPLTPKEKFTIARQDSFDPGTVALAAFIAGQSLLNNSNPSFGHGMAGYSRYLVTAYSDFVIGNFMTEGVYPTLFHQDPRYFRRGTGSGWSRTRYAVSQIFQTRKDSGGTQFNYSEILGNSTAVAISNTYYRDTRTAPDAIVRLSVQLGIDMASNVLKEFSQELSRKLARKRHAKAPRP